MKERIAVIFGGKSVEHDISIITGLQVMDNLSQKYEMLPIYIDVNGKWWIGQNLNDVNTFLDFKRRAKKVKQVSLIPGENKIILNQRARKTLNIDFAFLCTHGKNGEDGSLQGALELCRIPYSSCGVLSSAICLDKAIAKRILQSYKIKTPKFVDFYATEFSKNKSEVLGIVNETLTYPVIVKPANLGSSVGISVAREENELLNSIENAGLFDEKIVVEQFITDAQEYSCAVMKLNGKEIASDVQIVHKGEIFTFEDKYLAKKDEKNINVNKKLKSKIENLAKRAYRALDCDGIVRVDLLFDEKSNFLYINELNTIPGSLAFNLFKVPFRDLLDAEIEEARSNFIEKSNIVYEFNSKALSTYANLKKQNKYTK